MCHSVLNRDISPICPAAAYVPTFRREEAERVCHSVIETSALSVLVQRTHQHLEGAEPVCIEEMAAQLEYLTTWCRAQVDLAPLPSPKSDLVISNVNRERIRTFALVTDMNTVDSCIRTDNNSSY